MLVALKSVAAKLVKSLTDIDDLGSAQEQRIATVLVRWQVRELLSNA